MKSSSYFSNIFATLFYNSYEDVSTEQYSESIPHQLELFQLVDLNLESWNYYFLT